jgi:uncharacterized protein YggE
MKIRLILFLSFFWIAFLVLPAFGADSSTSPTIEITGKASITTVPNMVTILFAVETELPKASDAVRSNAEKTEKILNVLRKVSDQETRIKTSGYGLFPVYEKEGTTRTGLYRVRNSVIVESRDLDKVGAFVDQAAEAGVSRIANLTFGTDRAEELIKEAAAQALKNAMRDAEALAKVAGVSIKRIAKITYDPRENIPVRAMLEAAAPVPTPILVGEIQVQASVQLVFELN